MRRITAILLATFIIAGCDGTFRTKRFQSTVCGEEVTGYTRTAILYADSKLVVIPISKIRPETEWRFYLEPRLLRSADSQDNFEDNTVTISGKRSPDDDWINTAGTGAGGAITGNFEDDRILTACVNIDPNTPDDTEYQFMVHIDEIGDLDPRGRVRR